MRKIKFTFITFLLLFLFSINSVSADYKVVCKTGYKDGKCQDDTLVDKTITGDDPENPGYGGSYKITLEDESGKQTTAYCTDPFVEGIIDTGTTYKEADEINYQDYAAYQSIFNQTCGDEQLQSAAMKTYVANSGREYMGNNATTKEVYKGVMGSGSTSYKNDASETKKLQGVVSNAQNAANNATKEPGTSNSGITANAAGDTAIISGPTGGFRLDHSGNVNCTSIDSDGKTTYTCNIKDYCSGLMNPESGIEFIDVYSTNTPSVGKNPDGNNCKPCTPKMYTISSGTGGSVQRFVACVDKDGNSRGTNPSNDILPDDAMPSTEELVEEVELTCNNVETWDDVCDVPCDMIFDIPFDYPEGSEICNASGATVVEISEFGYSTSYEDTFCCLKEAAKDPDKQYVIATETILGDRIAKADGTEPVCKAFCTDKSYKLELPGPTSDSLDEEVLVNAGTFFNIEGKMETTSEIECYVTADYSALVEKIDRLRSDLADAITDLNMYKAYRDSDSSYRNHKKAHDHYDTVFYDCCSSGYTLTGGKCVKETEQADGTIKKDTKYVSTCSREEYSHTTYTYYGDYTIPGYKTVSFNKGGDNGGSYYTGSVSSNYKPCDLTEEEYNVNGFCEEYLKLREDIDKNISDAQNRVNTARDALDLSNPDGALIKALKDWDYCLGGGSYETKGWSFEKFNEKLTELEDGKYKNKCYTKITFTYEDGEYLGLTSWNPDAPNAFELTPTITPKPSTVQKYVPPGGTDKKNLKIGSCDVSGNCSEDTTEVPYADGFTYATNTITTTYNFNNKFCSPYNESEQVWFLGSKPESDCNGIVMEGFPVALETPQGEYSYRFDYKGVGYYYDSGGTECVGRLEPIIDFPDYSAYDNTCKYNVNNCRGCNVGCVDKGANDCNIDFVGDCDRGCKISCVGGGCILDFNAGLLATYRTLSLNNPFPEGIAHLTPSPLLIAMVDVKPSSTRDFPGSNWNTKKGQKVAEQIENEGEDIYKSEPDYVITLDPGTIQRIRDYNKDNPDYFSKSTLQCKEHPAGKKYSVCESSFVRGIFEKYNDKGWPSYGGNIQVELFTGPALK